MLNINYGHNHQLMEKCEILREYSIFVNSVKTEVKNSRDVHIAVEKAVNSCIADGILADFLKAHKSEVIEMCITEYNEKTARDMFEREAEEKGEKKGVEGVAKKMKENNCPVSLIQKCTGLDLQTIARL